MEVHHRYPYHQSLEFVHEKYYYYYYLWESCALPMFCTILLISPIVIEKKTTRRVDCWIEMIPGEKKLPLLHPSWIEFVIEGMELEQP